MAKFSGKIGYITEVEEPPSSGVFISQVTEKNVYGEIVKNSRRFDPGQKVNDDVTINNHFSIVADPFAYSHLHEMRYLEWHGVKWKINDVTIEYPRITLTVGGVYNG